MHDAKGRELKKGDRVLILATIKEVQATEDYCNVSVETIFGRRPDAKKEYIGGINTGVILRGNEDDANDLEQAFKEVK